MGHFVICEVDKPVYATSDELCVIPYTRVAQNKFVQEIPRDPIVLNINRFLAQVYIMLPCVLLFLYKSRCILATSLCRLP